MSTGRAIFTASIAAALLLPASAAAQDEEVVRGAEPNMRDIAVTPITDLNLSRDEIPEILNAAVRDPYADAGLKECGDIEDAIFSLDQVLGADLDIEPDDTSLSWRKAAKSAVGSFIPFRGVIREISGAASHQRKFQTAIFAGAVRRGYLKGLGQQKGCAYPARPAFERVKVTEDDMVVVEPITEAAPQIAARDDSVTFYSEPVVQGD